MVLRLFDFPQWQTLSLFFDSGKFAFPTVPLSPSKCKSSSEYRASYHSFRCASHGLRGFRTRFSTIVLSNQTSVNARRLMSKPRLLARSLTANMMVADLSMSK